MSRSRLTCACAAARFPSAFDSASERIARPRPPPSPAERSRPLAPTAPMVMPRSGRDGGVPPLSSMVSSPVPSPTIPHASIRSERPSFASGVERGERAFDGPAPAVRIHRAHEEVGVWLRLPIRVSAFAAPAPRVAAHPSITIAAARRMHAVSERPRCLRPPSPAASPRIDAGALPSGAVERGFDCAPQGAEGREPGGQLELGQYPRLGSARLGSARLGSARLGSARLGSARLGSARLGS